jgi:hypothetical protein
LKQVLGGGIAAHVTHQVPVNHRFVAVKEFLKGITLALCDPLDKVSI